MTRDEGFSLVKELEREAAELTEIAKTIRSLDAREQRILMFRAKTTITRVNLLRAWILAT